MTKRFAASNSSFRPSDLADAVVRAPHVLKRAYSSEFLDDELRPRSQATPRPRRSGIPRTDHARSIGNLDYFQGEF